MKNRILVVDDDADLVASVAAVLTAKGHEVTTARNGTEALAAVAKAAPDLIVLDVMMDSDTEGFTVAYKLQDSEATRRIPIVLLSGFTDHLAEKYDTFESIQGREWPAARFLKKPVTMNELTLAVTELLNEKAAQVL
jgi:DNA-binding response OmpR family regulator